MRRAAAIFILIFTALATAGSALASFDSAKNRFDFGREVRYDERTDGDFVAFGNDVEVSGGVGGDIFAGGRNVLITDSGTLNNIVALGASVKVRVKDARNVYAAGGDTNVVSEGQTRGVYMCGGNISLSGAVTDAMLIGAAVYVDGEVKENLQIRSDNITFGTDASVGGEITIYSSKHPKLPSSIDETKVHYKRPAMSAQDAQGSQNQDGASPLRRICVILAATGVISAAVVSVLLNALCAGFWRDKASDVRRRFWRDALRGLIAAIVAPVAAVLVMLTVVGIPLGALLLTVYCVLIYLAPIAAGIIAGRAVFPRMNRYVSGAIWTVFLRLLLLVPYVRVAVWAFATLYGLGALVSCVNRHGDTRVKPEVSKS
jgi:hypothetical protein